MPGQLRRRSSKVWRPAADPVFRTRATQERQWLAPGWNHVYRWIHTARHQLPGPPRPGARPRLEPGYDAPDLFSELAAEAFDTAEPAQAAGGAGAPEAIVEELERELLGPLVRGDIGRTAVLLHPDFVEIGSSGRMWTRDAMMMALEEDPGERTDIEILSADRIEDTSVLLTYRSFGRAGTTLRSSLWVLDGARWRLRFHQGTPEA